MTDNPTIQAFIRQGDVCESMGSAFTGNLCRRFAKKLDRSTKVGALCLDWTGDPAGAADNVPLRLCGGLHALVLSKQDGELAQNYPPHSDQVPSWPLINRVLDTHEAFLLEWMKSPPQTNEVARSAIIWPGLMAIVDKTGLPLRLLEVGASGGLNLQAPHYAYQLGSLECGELGSALKLAPKWLGTQPVFSEVSIHSAAGCDLNPLNPTSEEDALRLRSYVWPDQIERNHRIDAALTIAQKFPIKIEKMDALDWLARELAEPVMDCCTVVYSTVAWQYLPPEAQVRGEKIISEAGQRADSQHAPLMWLRVEADDKSPGAGIDLTRWPENLDVSLGRADFHARWVDWNGFIQHDNE